MDSGAGSPYGNPVPLANHLVQDVAFSERPETLIDSRDAGSVDFTTMVGCLSGPQCTGGLDVSCIEVLELAPNDFLVLISAHEGTEDRRSLELSMVSGLKSSKGGTSSDSHYPDSLGWLPGDFDSPTNGQNRETAQGEVKILDGS
jgi:hypothetical protein